MMSAGRRAIKMKRRTFLKHSGVAAGVVAGQSFGNSASNVVTLVIDPSDKIAASAPVEWSVKQLKDALIARGLDARITRQIAGTPIDVPCIVVSGASAPQARDILRPS